MLKFKFSVCGKFEPSYFFPSSSKMADEEGDTGVDVDDQEDFLATADEVEEEVIRAAVPDPLAHLYKFHPETVIDYAETVLPKIPLLSAPPSQKKPDEGHKSQPFLSTFERTKLIGFRANQISQGARPYILVPESVTSTVEIAKMELEQRRLPFIIKRPMPDGTFEYWRLSDLMII